MCDCDVPSAFYQTTRKARKDHKCCECHGTIAKGETYQYSSGIWDGSPGHFKTCMACVSVKETYTSHLTRYDCTPSFGELYEDWPQDELPPHVLEVRRLHRANRTRAIGG